MLIRVDAVAASDRNPSPAPRIPITDYHELLRYADHPVALPDRLILLSCLDEHGSLTLSNCLYVLRNSSSPVAILAALLARGVLIAEPDNGSLEPNTRIRRTEASPQHQEDGL